MAETPSAAEAFEAEGRQGVVRLKMPAKARWCSNDLVRGTVEFDWAREQDHVIQRADGSCLYHLASVVDDHDMRITHVIRAEEHLSNTPRQVFIAQRSATSCPSLPTCPFVAEPGSKNKLSKRKLDKYLKNRDFAERSTHGARRSPSGSGWRPSAETFNPVIVDFYEQVGYLPDAILNYLAAAGLVAGRQDRGFQPREQMIEHFSLERVNRPRRASTRRS